MLLKNTSIITLSSILLFTACNKASEFHEQNVVSSAISEESDITEDDGYRDPPTVAQNDLTNDEPKVDSKDEANEEVKLASEKACKYSFGATSIGSNVKITIISAPASMLEGFENEELSKLSINDQKFMMEAVQNKLSGVSVVSQRSATIQSANESLVVKSEQAKVRFTKVESDLDLNYLVKGKTASIQATSIRRGSKLIAVLDGSESASAQFTSIEDEAEIFLIYKSRGDNVTCISATGANGNIASYIYGEKGYVAQGILKGTDFSEEGTILHQVIGSDNTFSSFTGTRIASTNVILKTMGGKFTTSLVKGTSLGSKNKYDIQMKGNDETKLSFTGTSAGLDTDVSLDLDGDLNTSAEFKFTAENNIHIDGKIKGKDPKINLLGRLNMSTTAKVSVDLQTK